MSDIDALVRRVDEDRWLASRFAPPKVRERLVALYALNYEIARTAESVTQGGIGDIRLAWWREAIGEVLLGGAPRQHPRILAFADAVRGVCVPHAALDALIDARGKDLEPEPFANWADIDAYLDATAGGVIRVAAAACEAQVDDDSARQAALVWGYVGLLRAAPFWAARGRSVLPPGATFAEMLSHAAVLYGESLRAPIPSAWFPALGYVALAPRYLSAMRKPTHDFTQNDAGRPLLLRQLTLVAASATGRL